MNSWGQPRKHFVCIFHKLYSRCLFPVQLIWALLLLFSTKLNTRILWKIVNDAATFKTDDVKNFPSFLYILAVEESAEEKLRDCFNRFNYDIKAFSSLRYVGIQTSITETTDYNKLIAALRMELENTTVRSPRQPSVIFKAIRALNKKFAGEIIEKSINPFPEQYFTCPIYCDSCNRRCQRSMGHDGDNHLNSQPCQHQHQFENKVDICKSCYNNGREVVVIRKETWTYIIIDCPHCGEIARNWKYWGSATDSSAVRCAYLSKLYAYILFEINK